DRTRSSFRLGAPGRSPTSTRSALLVEREVSEALEHLEHRLRSEVALPVGLVRAEILMRKSRPRERQLQLLRGVEDDVQVLLNESHHESGIIVSLDDRLP